MYNLDFMNLRNLDHLFLIYLKNNSNFSLYQLLLINNIMFVYNIQKNSTFLKSIYCSVQDLSNIF